LRPTVSIATFPFRCAGSTPALISLDPITVINAPSPTDALRALAEMAIAASPPRLSTHPGRFLAVLRPPSRSSLTSNPHSAAAQPGPNFPRRRALALFGRLSAERA